MRQAVNHTGSAKFSNRKGCGHTHRLMSVTSTKTLPSCMVQSILAPCASPPTAALHPVHEKRLNQLHVLRGQQNPEDKMKGSAETQAS